MPDPRLFIQGLVVATVASLLVTGALLRLRPGPAGSGWGGRQAAGWGALAGLVAGWWRLGYPLPWPPTTGLNRLLVIVLPALLMVDWVCARVFGWREPGAAGNGLWGPRLTWRGCLCLGICSLTIPVVLLWNSVHLGGAGSGPWLPVRGAAFVATGLCLALGGWSLQRLADRPYGVVVPLSLAAAIFAGGLCVLLAGYIKGGAVAFPLAGSLLGVLAASAGGPLMGRLDPGTMRSIRQCCVAWGICALYGVLLVGCAFGKLPGTRALLVGLAPLAAWASQPPALGRLASSWRMAVGLAVVALLLLGAIVAGQQEFERTMGPLIR